MTMKKLSLYTTVLSSVCLLPIAAMAQDNSDASTSTQFSEFTLGTQWVGGTNTGQYGRYNGFSEQGLDVLGGFTIRNRDAWDSGKTFYYNFSGLNLNFQTGNRLARGFRDSTYANNTGNDLGPTAELNFSIGEQGTWGFTAGYNAISYTGNIIYSLWTVNGATGTLNNGLAAWGGATNSPLTIGTRTSFTALTLAPYLTNRYQTGTRRDILQFGGQYISGDWIIKSNVRHEHKEGTVEESLRETYGGMAFTMPVDFDTDRFDVSAGYNLPDFQALLQYTYSRFTDNNNAVALPFPVSIATQSASSGPYAQTGLYATPPTNSAHYVTAMVGYNVMPQTRITFNARGGVELQDDMFPANSADPNLSSTLGNPTYVWWQHLNSYNQGTVGTSLGAAAWVYQGNIAISSNLATDLDARASYAVDGRHVHVDEYQVWSGGSSADATANTHGFYVVPQSWFKQTAKIEAGYRILPESNTKLTVSYTYNNIHRRNAQVEHSDTNTESVQLSSMLGHDVMGRVTYEHSERSGELIYGASWGYLETGAPDEFNTPSGAYYQAPMTSDSFVARLDYAPAGNLSGGIYVKYADENYHYPAIPNTAPSGDWNLTGYGVGIKQDSNLTVGPDINYRPNENLNLHLFYTYERIYFDNRGNGQCAESNTGNCAGSVGYFQNTYASDTHTVGVNSEWQASDRLKLIEDYNYSSGTIVFGEFDGVTVPTVIDTYQNVTPFPNINSTMHQLRLTAVYQLTSRIEWSLMYQFSMFHNNDWDNLNAPIQTSTNSGTGISILTPGYSSPNYNVSTIGTVIKVAL